MEEKSVESCIIISLSFMVKEKLVFKSSYISLLYLDF